MPSNLTASADAVTLVATEERLTLRVVEEETGAVRVRTVTRHEQKEIPISLRRKSARVERVPVGRVVDAEYSARQQGDTWVVPVFEYVPVTEMKLVLKEEIHVTTVVVEEPSVHHAMVQRQEVVVERRIGATGEWLSHDMSNRLDDSDTSSQAA